MKLKFLPAACDSITIYDTRSRKRADARVQVDTTDTFLYLFCPTKIKSGQDTALRSETTQWRRVCTGLHGTHSH